VAFPIEEQNTMQRVAFLLRLKPGTGPEYDKSHAAVWPEMLALLKRAGISEYSIFRRDELLFLYMHIEGDFDAVWDKIDPDPVNIRWQQAMSAYFLPKQEARDGERFPMMQEVFYLP
jgi:L-rhamnose mutarotase